MPRLIDADKLIKILDVGSGSAIEEALLGIVRCQPTAYDVNKVVEQLERHSMPFMGDNDDRDVDLKKAIEIVKSGGVNENE